MTRHNESDPGPAARTAKNVPAGPGLPNTTDSDMRRSPMVDGSSTPEGGEPVEARSTTAAIVALLRVYPDVAAPAEERAVWFARKAAVLRRIAADGDQDPEHTLALAATAEAEALREQAAALRGEAR